MSKDLISREALKFKWVDIFDSSYGDDCAKMFKKAVDNAPTVDITEEQAIDKLHETGWMQKHDKEMTARPTGKWIKESNGRTTDIYRCSICKRSIMLCKGADLTKYPFCHCGAKMEEAEND